MKRMTMMCVVLAGCSFSSKIGGPTTAGGGGGGSQGASAAAVGTARMPDLTGMTRKQALAVLRQAGFEIAAVAEGDQLCPAREPMIAQGAICDQQPRAGSENSVRVPVRVTIEHDTPTHGRVGTRNEWRLMPDITGKPVDEARAILGRAGFDVATHFQILEGDCAVGTVCTSQPPAGGRVVLSRGGRFSVGVASGTPAPAQPDGDGGYF